jgi:hypothetical protein
MQVPLHILLFNFGVFISFNLDSQTEFIPNSDRLWDKKNCTYGIYTASSLMIKFKYERIKFKEKECEAEHA